MTWWKLVINILSLNQNLSPRVFSSLLNNSEVQFCFVFVKNRQWITVSDHLGHKKFINLDITSYIGLDVEERSFLKEHHKVEFKYTAELQNANPEKLFKQEHLQNTQQLTIKLITSDFSNKNCMGAPLKWGSRAAGGGEGAGRERWVSFLKVVLHWVGEGPL